jgi:hypothetical protein
VEISLPIILFLTLSSAIVSYILTFAIVDSRNAVNQYILEARPPAMKLPIPGDISQLVPSHFLNILLKISNPIPRQCCSCDGWVGGRTSEHGCETTSVNETSSYTFPHPRYSLAVDSLPDHIYRSCKLS